MDNLKFQQLHSVQQIACRLLLVTVVFGLLGRCRSLDLLPKVVEVKTVGHGGVLQVRSPSWGREQQFDRRHGVSPRSQYTLWGITCYDCTIFFPSSPYPSQPQPGTSQNDDVVQYLRSRYASTNYNCLTMGSGRPYVGGCGSTYTRWNILTDRTLTADSSGECIYYKAGDFYSESCGNGGNYFNYHQELQVIYDDAATTCIGLQDPGSIRVVALPCETSDRRLKWSS